MDVAGFVLFFCTPRGLQVGRGSGFLGREEAAVRGKVALVKDKFVGLAGCVGSGKARVVRGLILLYSEILPVVIGCGLHVGARWEVRYVGGFSSAEGKRTRKFFTYLKLELSNK